jgi:hypothetical protein
MYRVLMHRRLGRILVSGKDDDSINEGWELIYTSERWIDAYEYARNLADKYDYVLEWYLEEERQEIPATAN